MRSGNVYKYKKINLYIFVLIMLVCFSSSCGSTNSIQRISEKKSEEVVNTVMASSYVESNYKLYIEDENFSLSPFEPIDGCYLGAYILSNKIVEYDIEKFEEKVSNPHSIYIFNMRLGEKFPTEWILKCISRKKTPLIVINAPNDYMPFQENLLERTAKDFGKFQVPMLIDFYPNPHSYGEDYESYVNFYRSARETFKKHSKNSAFTFSINYDSVFNFSNYYPGNEYIDWLGINIFYPVYKDDEKNEYDVWKSIDYFYYKYQNVKPLMISQLAISHYSTKDNTYHIDEASKMVKTLYKKIAEDYPRFKAINYMDFNNIDISPKSIVADDFSVTNDEKMLESYIEATSNDRFLPEIQITDTNEKKTQTIKSAFKIFQDEDEFYVSEKSLYYELGISALINTEQFRIIIENEEYYPLKIVSSNFGINFDIDEKSKKITAKNYINSAFKHR